MPRITPQTELDPLVALIAAQPDGLGIEAIQSHSNSLSRRTLQRRLALSVAQGRIQMLGEARAVRPPVGYRQAFLEQYRPNTRPICRKACGINCTP